MSEHKCLLPERTSHRPPLCSLGLSATASTLARCPALPLPACSLVIHALTLSLAWTLLRCSSWCVYRPGQATSATLLASLTALSPPDFRLSFAFVSPLLGEETLGSVYLPGWSCWRTTALRDIRSCWGSCLPSQKL